MKQSFFTNFYSAAIFASLLFVHFGASAATGNCCEGKAGTVLAAPAQEEDLVEDILQAIPNPLEISSIVKEVSSIYNSADLNNHSKVSSYNSQFKQAINLGIYGTDLGFANIYGRNQDALNYLNSVKDLADKLSIGQFFDYATIKKLTESADNLDELLGTTTSNFNKINAELRSQKREHLSILILTGGWLEALHLTTLVNQRKPNPVLREKIGEQKIVLEKMMMVMDLYKGKPDFPALIADLKELMKIYDRVDIEVEVGEPKMEVVNGVLSVVDSSTSTVKMTDGDAQAIASLVKSIRNKLIQ